MLVYLDSSALVKRVVDEDHASVLRDRLDELVAGPNELLTSTLGWIEVSRALHGQAVRTGVPLGAATESNALAGVAGYPISYGVVSVARRIGPPLLRSLDAIHCATATLSEAEVLLSYDENLLAAAKSLGLPVESPGMQQ